MGFLLGCPKTALNYTSEMKIVNIGLYVRLCLLKYAFNLVLCFLLLHRVRKDVRKETSGKRHWLIYSNHCMLPAIHFLAKAQWIVTPATTQPLCRVLFFQTQALTKLPWSGLEELRGGVCQLHSRYSRQWEVWRFPRGQFHTCETVLGRDMGSLVVGPNLIFHFMSLSNKENKYGERSLEIGENPTGFAVKLLLVL